MHISTKLNENKIKNERKILLLKKNVIERDVKLVLVLIAVDDEDNFIFMRQIGFPSHCIHYLRMTNEGKCID